MSSGSMTLILNRRLLIPVALAVLLIAVSGYSFLLFHTLAEFFAIMVAFLLFVVAWHTYAFTRNNFLMYLGCGYFWVAVIDMIHTVAYKGVGILPITTANPSIQLWISGRYFEALLLLSAPLFLTCGLARSLTVALFGAAATGLIVLVNLGWFPDSFIEGQGLTRFKIVSEYIIIAILLGAVAFMIYRRDKMEPRVLTLLIASIVLTIGAEIAFTVYVSVFGLSNLVGHIFKLFSYWLIFEAIVHTTLTEPYQVMARGSSTYDAIPEPAIVTDKNGIIRQVNAAACRTAGLTEAALIGRHCHDVFHPADTRINDCVVCRNIAQGTALAPTLVAYPEENEFREFMLSPVNTPGSPPGMVHVGRDVTELMHTQDALRQAQKMEAVGQLTGGIAHDFNNILMVIMGNMELLEDQFEDGDKRTENVRRTFSAARRGAALTHRMLAFSRRQPLKPKVINLNTLVVDTTSLLERTLGEHIEIEVTHTPGLWACEADPTQLENVLINLAINSRDAMPNGGKLTIESANVWLNDSYAVDHPGVHPGQYVMLAVTDTGTGMPPEVIEQIFEPFFTTKEVGKGSGLGMSMIYGFVKQSGGDISVSSEVGDGTTVRIYLPRVESEANNINAALPAKPEAVSNGGAVLVVEDDPDVRILAVRMLRSLGYDVIEAEDGPTAITMLESAGKIDLLLTDVILPREMTGRQLADEVIRQRPDVIVIYMSGYSEDAIVQKGRLDEDVLLLRKPFTLSDLSTLLREALGNRITTA